MRAMSTGRRMWHQRARHVGAGLGSRRGLTLVELLAAMIVLLVGVYAIAALFPKLSRSISDEETRTSMSRATQRLAEGYRSGELELPDATAPHYTQVDAVEPGSSPDDPDSNLTGTNPLNSRDDFIEVYGERVTVPAPPTPGGYPCYVPKLGLVDPSMVPVVHSFREMKEAYRDPGANTTPRDGEFYLRTDGQFLFNGPGGGNNGAIVYYDWVLPGGIIRRANGELVPNSGSYVQAVASRGGRVVPGSVRAYARYPWACSFGPPATIAGRVCWVDATAGQSIYFPATAAGTKLRVDYRVRREDLQAEGTSRRAKIMFEDKRVPSAPPYQIDLNFDGLSDEYPLVANALDGTDIADVWLLVVDLTDGATWVWDDNSDGTGAITEVDFSRGKFWMNGSVVTGASGTARAGHPIRIYYRTADEHTIQVQKAPTEFVEVDSLTHPANAYLPNWEHRRFRIGTQAAASGNYYYLCDFPAYLEDQAVEVDYTYDAGDGQPTPVSNEVHVISDLGDPNLGFGFVLNHSNVMGLYEVTGASARIVGWWRTEDGRVSRFDVANIMFPTSEI